MDINKLNDAFNKDYFIDLTLILSDANQEITIDLHKIILYSSCLYFEKLLTNCKEKHLNKIQIQVPNAFVCYDIIMSFYGQVTNLGNLQQWYYLLEYIRCCDFLGLEKDITKLKNLKVPKEGFDLLLQIVELFGYDYDTTKLIINNLPDDYDLSKLNKDLIKKIIK